MKPGRCGGIFGETCPIRMRRCPHAPNRQHDSQRKAARQAGSAVRWWGHVPGNVPSRGKYWRLKYRLEGKEKRLALGVYPDVTLKEARLKCDDVRKLLSQGVDPSAEKMATKTAEAETFEAIYREWLDKFSPRWAPHS